MQAISLKNIPNQSFTIILDNNEWGFVIKTTNGVVCVTLTLNGVLIVTNAKAVANQKIIPFEYQEMQSGNFLFLTQNFQLPDYTQFGITQTLTYLSAAELAIIRQEPTGIITAADFNPIAALPLRFAPVGYSSPFDVVLLEGGIGEGLVLLEGGGGDISLE